MTNRRHRNTPAYNEYKPQDQKGASNNDQARKTQREDADNEEARSPGRSQVDLRPDRTQVIPDDESDVARSTPTETPSSDNHRDQQPNQPNAVPEVVQQQILAYLNENHLHLPIAVPDAEHLKELRADVPEIYDLYVHGLRQSLDDESFRQHAPYEIPAQYARRGQYLGLTAVIITLGIVAFAIWMNAMWLAGIIGTLDLVALAAVFGSDSAPNQDK